MAVGGDPGPEEVTGRSNVCVHGGKVYSVCAKTHFNWSCVNRVHHCHFPPEVPGFLRGQELWPSSFHSFLLAALCLGSHMKSRWEGQPLPPPAPQEEHEAWICTDVASCHLGQSP
jgi:hypothetical protein